MNAWANYRAGVRIATPIMIAYLLIGIATGVLGVTYGLSPAEILLLSLLLFAGSAQFVFPILYAGSAQLLVTTIFFINLRHLLYSSAMALQSGHIRTALRIWMGAQITDESFLIASGRLNGEPVPHGMWLIGIQTAAHCSWLVGNMIGALFGASIDLEFIGIDFAATAMFIALLVPQLLEHGRKVAACTVALLAAAGAVAFDLVAPTPASVILVALAASVLGVALFGPSERDRRTAAHLNTAREEQPE